MKLSVIDEKSYFKKILNCEIIENKGSHGHWHDHFLRNLLISYVLTEYRRSHIMGNGRGMTPKKHDLQCLGSCGHILTKISKRYRGSEGPSNIYLYYCQKVVGWRENE